MRLPSRPHVGVLLFLLVCAVYSGSLGNGFHFDDFHAVVRNPHIRDPARIPSFFTDPSAFSVNPAGAMYRPLLLTSFAVDHALWGLRPWGYHAVNVLLHGLAAVAALRCLTLLGVGRTVAVGGALVFAVHPVNSEAVNYVSSRSEVLMGLLFLGATSAYLTYRQHHHRRHLALALGAGAAGLLAKSVAVCLPAALVLADLFTGGWRRVRRAVGVYVAFAAPVLVYLVFVRRHAARALLEEPVRDAAAQLWTQIKAAVYYLQLTIMPVRLNVEHQFDPSRDAEPAAVAAGLFLLCAAVTALLAHRRAPWLWLGSAWWALLLVPASTVPLIVLVNEHRLYTATLGFSLVAAACLASLRGRLGARRLPVATLGLGTYTCLLALGTLLRTQVWQGELTLWEDAARKSPAMLRPHLRHADALAGADSLEAAEAAYHRALALRPQHPAARTNLGLLYQRQGRWAAAMAQYDTLLRVSADAVPARLNLAGLLLREGRWQAARDHYEQVRSFGDPGGQAALRLGQIALRHAQDPELALAWFDVALEQGAAAADAQVGRGVALRALRREPQAEAAYRAALAADSSRSDAWYNLGNLLLGAGDLEAARSAYRRVIELADDAGTMRNARKRLRDMPKASATAVENDI